MFPDPTTWTWFYYGSSFCCLCFSLFSCCILLLLFFLFVCVCVCVCVCFLKIFINTSCQHNIQTDQTSHICPTYGVFQSNRLFCPAHQHFQLIMVPSMGCTKPVVCFILPISSAQMSPNVTLDRFSQHRTRPFPASSWGVGISYSHRIYQYRWFSSLALVSHQVILDTKAN